MASEFADARLACNNPTEVRRQSAGRLSSMAVSVRNGAKRHAPRSDLASAEGRPRTGRLCVRLAA